MRQPGWSIIHHAVFSLRAAAARFTVSDVPAVARPLWQPSPWRHASPGLNTETSHPIHYQAAPLESTGLITRFYSGNQKQIMHKIHQLYIFLFYVLNFFMKKQNVCQIWQKVFLWTLTCWTGYALL